MKNIPRTFEAQLKTAPLQTLAVADTKSWSPKCPLRRKLTASFLPQQRPR